MPDFPLLVGKCRLSTDRNLAWSLALLESMFQSPPPISMEAFLFFLNLWYVWTDFPLSRVNISESIWRMTWIKILCMQPPLHLSPGRVTGIVTQSQALLHSCHVESAPKDGPPPWSSSVPPWSEWFLWCHSLSHHLLQLAAKLASRNFLYRYAENVPRYRSLNRFQHYEDPAAALNIVNGFCD